MNNAFRLIIPIGLAAFVVVGCDRGHSPDDGHDHSASPESAQDGYDHAAPGGDGHEMDAAEDDHGINEPHDDGGDDDVAMQGDIGHLEDLFDAIDAPAPDDHDDGDGHDHAADEPEDEANHIELTSTQREQIGLRLATAQPGTIAVGRTFPGEVMLDPDRTAHIVPRAAGIVREANASLGDHVGAGDVLAWIESDELAEAKLAFFSKHTEVGCCQIELPRAKEIFENTSRLLALLESEPEAAEIRELDDLEMGVYRGNLLTTYSAYIAAKTVFERERGLLEKGVSSESEFIEAESAYKKATALFAAARDTARYQVRIAYTEAARTQQVAEFEAVAAEQRLRLKGADDDVISGLLALAPQTANLEPCLCDDPNCKEGEMPSVTETLGKEERLGWYALRAPFAGYVTDKHLTLGEKVDSDESVITIADTSSVWVRFNVYQKDLALVATGQTVRIDPGAGMPTANGTVAYMPPVIDADTRTAQARVELPNPDGELPPGLYATVHVDVNSVEASVVIDKDAVQTLDGENVVFIEAGDGFMAAPVQLGPSDRNRVIVLAGLKPGQHYVERGAFELKAKIVTSGIDAHAGHGH